MKNFWHWLTKGHWPQWQTKEVQGAYTQQRCAVCHEQRILIDWNHDYGDEP